MGRYEQRWGDTSKDGEIRGKMGRYEQRWGDMSKDGEI
jgi:hypothetical protein